jgi:nucleotide-binding universal stress UspA family protein
VSCFDPVEDGRKNVMYETIVVGYDGSEGGERALARAAALAGSFSSTVVVVVVEQVSPTVASPMGIGMGEVPVLAPEPAEQGWLVDSQIERARSVLDGHGIAYEVASPLGNNAAAEIVDVADARTADLIVVGTNEPGLLERLLTGSVSGSVARSANCDVLVVHEPR